MSDKLFFRSLLRETFRRGNWLAVVVITLVPMTLGFVESLLNPEVAAEQSGLQLLVNLGYSFSVTTGLYFGCTLIIRSLHHYLPWSDKFLRRLFVEVALIFVYSTLFVWVVLKLFMAWMPPGCMGTGPGFIFNQILLGNTITLVVVAMVEGRYFFHRWKESLVKAEVMERERLQSKLSTLRAQLDPHFMFNSLNVLSSLIRSDPAKAERFVDNFSEVYRYLLEVKEEMVVTLEEELRFVRNYLKLQQIRFDKGLQVQFNIEPAQLAHFLPPLSLQELVSNALKHNAATTREPLELSISSCGEELCVRNNFNPRSRPSAGTGTGLENLRQRYHFLGAPAPTFTLSEKCYEARLPLIMPET